MTTRRSPAALFPVLLAATLLAGAPARGVDGVIELNAVRMAAGIPAIGDAPGPPLTIGQPGSYVLTSDLFTTGANENVVEITAAHVTLDLNGFAVRCLFALTPCKGTGTGVGIVVPASATNATIRNGTVRDMADDGINGNGSSGMVVKDVRAVANGDDGISAGFGALVEGCVALDNGTGSGGSSGIESADHSLVRRSTAWANATEFGIYGGGIGTVVEDNTVNANDALGIACNGCTIRGNAVSQNGGTGISGNDSLIKDNAVSENAVGITGTRAQVIDNRIADNTGFGIDTAAAYGGNVLTGNNAGQEVQSNAPGAQIDANFCGSDTVCP